MVVPAVAVLVALFVLPPAWGAVLVAAAVVWEIGEKAFWVRFLRRYPVRVGREALIGMPVVVTAACRPDGRVRLHGESWQARCSTGAQPGDALVVEDVDRITLIIGKRQS